MNQVAPHPPLTDFYGDAQKRERYVRDIFDETAPWYDWTVRFMSFGSGHWYRREALKRAGLTANDRLLDLATGTGVVARAALGMTRNIVAADASIGMLRAGRVPLRKLGSAAERLPFRDASFDMITIGFALRHFADLATVFRECRRVLRPGGRLLILEITSPDSRAGRAFLGAYMGAFVPLAVRVRTRSARAAQLFRYYWATTRDCVRPDVILQTMRHAGFSEAKRNVELGVFSEYVGRV
ncbi:MAG TPA: class I SAM-dependent methyltransferase [Thermoanaerobaculia bacterium]|nr:class I SAM-dependent methyltransferase [Thermoanaerobaculia bacterium]